MNTETLSAIVSAIIVFAGAIAGALGFDLSTDLLVQIISVIVFVAAIAYGIWKNHNFTEAAQKGQELVDTIKQQAKNTKE